MARVRQRLAVLPRAVLGQLHNLNGIRGAAMGGSSMAVEALRLQDADQTNLSRTGSRVAYLGFETAREAIYRSSGR